MECSVIITWTRSNYGLRDVRENVAVSAYTFRDNSHKTRSNINERNITDFRQEHKQSNS